MSQNGPIETTAVVLSEPIREVLMLPDRATLQRKLAAVRDFQTLVKSQMIQGHDYGVIPGTDKPTLLKPGAEKIAKLLELADTYEVIEQTVDWDRPFFHFLIRCRLVTMGSGITVSEGVGECNSYESKYRYRWVFDSGLPPGLDKSALRTRTINTKRGQAKQYQMENEDIFSQVNTLLKMAKKRALVDASLSAGRLSDVFTQDMEDLGPIEPPPPHVEPATGEIIEAEPESSHANFAPSVMVPLQDEDRPPTAEEKADYTRGLDRAKALGMDTSYYAVEPDTGWLEMRSLRRRLMLAITTQEQAQQKLPV